MAAANLANERVGVIESTPVPVFQLHLGLERSQHSDQVKGIHE
jgi:hypothetical protein